jgi:hypothetical protein
VGTGSACRGPSRHCRTELAASGRSSRLPAHGAKWWVASSRSALPEMTRLPPNSVHEPPSSACRQAVPPTVSRLPRNCRT